MPLGRFLIQLGYLKIGKDFRNSEKNAESKDPYSLNSSILKVIFAIAKLLNSLVGEQIANQGRAFSLATLAASM